MLDSTPVLALALACWPQEPPSPRPADFHYDAPDTTVAARLTEGPNRHDSDVVVLGGETWCAWLEFEPGRGERVRVGRLRGERIDGARQLSGEPGLYARPSLTVDASGRLWLSYEAERDRQWDVFVVEVKDGEIAGEPRRVSPSAGADIGHRVVADPAGGLWFAWQSDRGGQFDVLAAAVGPRSIGAPTTVSDNPYGDWQPSLAVTASGDVFVAWDAYDGTSFDADFRVRAAGEWRPVHHAASSEAFEGHTDLAVDRDGRCFLTWEAGGPNWGRAFRGIDTQLVLDAHGPLHRFRSIHVATLATDGSVRQLRAAFPMPSRELAAARGHAERGLTYTGSFYERPRLAVDGGGRVWLAYRHLYTPWLGVEHRSHVEAGWGVYARRLEPAGWSRLFGFTIGQGDGMQRLELAPAPRGILASWTAGRTHRKPSGRPRGLVSATLEVDAPAAPPTLDEATRTPAARPTRPTPNRPTATVGGRRCELFFGDLHRHTDLSLCRVPIDGTIDDAYRYAIEVAGLDFLGITDHSRDLAKGDALSQVWLRSRKEVLRHELASRFWPFYAYERSHGTTADHNVISLRDDMLRPHTYPVPEFWQELDEDTLTIPHQPIRRDTWKYQDDVLRPLVEIYQGCRDASIEHDVHQGLDHGYHLGFIASSDHMATSSSYACVWAEQPGRESIFRALQARRTYGATARIELLVRADTAWMGEILTLGAAAPAPAIELTAKGTANIVAAGLIVDGALVRQWKPDRREVELRAPLSAAPGGYAYFHFIQADGNQAWSSPIWLERR